MNASTLGRNLTSVRTVVGPSPNQQVYAHTARHIAMTTKVAITNLSNERMQSNRSDWLFFCSLYRGDRNTTHSNPPHSNPHLFKPTSTSPHLHTHTCTNTHAHTNSFRVTCLASLCNNSPTPFLNFFCTIHEQKLFCEMTLYHSISRHLLLLRNCIMLHYQPKCLFSSPGPFQQRPICICSFIVYLLNNVCIH